MCVSDRARLSSDLVQQSSQGDHTVGVEQTLLVDGVSLQEVLKHQQEGGHQVLL